MKSNFYISFGIWVALLPFVGLPSSWVDTLTALSGLFLVLVSFGPTILKKLQTKPKAKKKQEKPEIKTEPFGEQKIEFVEPKNESGVGSDKHEN